MATKHGTGLERAKEKEGGCPVQCLKRIDATGSARM